MNIRKAPKDPPSSRTAIGLATRWSPKRFLLWATGNLLTAFSQPVARLVYGLMTGADAAPAESIQMVGGSLITVTLAISSVTGLTTTVILFLAFVPTSGYERWITARAVAQRG